MSDYVLIHLFAPFFVFSSHLECCVFVQLPSVCVIVVPLSFFMSEMVTPIPLACPSCVRLNRLSSFPSMTFIAFHWLPACLPTLV
mmetsp:Transcript_39225/g.77177  ORF Transcript_39225/g.77177 Transcript_39225/m.77177 type:complete len:85 (-) Transcript_39225:4692-4946(-)